MKVSDVMSGEPRAVGMADALDAAAQILWEQDCGFVPVTDGAGILVGVLTDRDLCMASYTQGRSLSDVPVLAAMARELTTCTPGEDLKVAMKAMAAVRVHRLPVVDEQGVLVGVLSCNDLIQACQARPAAVSAKAVMETLAAIKEPRSGARSFGAAPAKKPATRKARSSKATASKATASKSTASKAGKTKKASTAKKTGKASASKARSAKARSSKGKA